MVSEMAKKIAPMQDDSLLQLNGVSEKGSNRSMARHSIVVSSMEYTSTPIIIGIASDIRPGSIKIRP